MQRTRVLLTGFEPFAGWSANPSGDLARVLGRDAGLRAAGIRTAVLPVHRTRAPAELLRLLRRHRPHVLVLTGLAAGRDAVSLERIAVNCWRRAGDRGVGVPIDAAGPDGLFATLPAREALRALAAGGAPAALSETAGTYCCNLVLYRALRWAAAGVLPGGGDAPGRAGFVHLPATAESLPRGRSEPCVSRQALEDGLRALCLVLAKDAPGPAPAGRRRSVRPASRTR